MSTPSQFDFSFAVSNTRTVLAPTRRLETFGVTVLHYHLITELMDTVGKIRIREGRIQAHRPQIITPASIADKLLEGFGDEADNYVSWLREHEKDLRILQYGFVIRKQEIREELITDTLEAVTDRVVESVRKAEDPLAAVVVGVDSPWEVCLLKMMFDVSTGSYATNVRELESHRMFDPKGGARQEIEAEFRLANHRPDRTAVLGTMLQKHGLFSEYEDRFFALVNSQRKR